MNDRSLLSSFSMIVYSMCIRCALYTVNSVHNMAKALTIALTAAINREKGERKRTKKTHKRMLNHYGTEFGKQK